MVIEPKVKLVQSSNYITIEKKFFAFSGSLPGGSIKESKETLGVYLPCLCNEWNSYRFLPHYFQILCYRNCNFGLFVPLLDTISKGFRSTTLASVGEILKGFPIEEEEEELASSWGEGGVSIPFQGAPFHWLCIEEVLIATHCIESRFSTEPSTGF